MKTNNVKTVLSGALFGVSLGLMQSAAAQAPAGGIPFGPMIAYPSIDASLGYNDNVLATNSNKVSSTTTSITPSVRLEGKFGSKDIEIGARTNLLQYTSSSADKTTTYSLYALGNLALTERTGLKLRGEYQRGADARGSTDVNAPTPSTWDQNGIDGVFAYGAPGAQGRIEVDGAYYTRRYQNNPVVTTALNTDKATLGGTFFWRVAPKTELLFQAQQTNIDYKLSTSFQDSTERRYLVGAKWEATALTSGTFKIGRQTKDFSAAGRNDFSGVSWDAGVRWSPLTYSVFDFTAAKRTTESTGTGDFLLSNMLGANWNHAWNSRVSSGLLANWKRDQFMGVGNGINLGRIDSTLTLGANLSYAYSRTLKFGADYTHTGRDSKIPISIFGVLPPNLNYQRNVFMLTVKATL